MRELVYLLTILNGVEQNSGIKRLIQCILLLRHKVFIDGHPWENLFICLGGIHLSEENRNSVSAAVFVFIYFAQFCSLCCFHASVAIFGDTTNSIAMASTLNLYMVHWSLLMALGHPLIWRLLVLHLLTNSQHHTDPKLMQVLVFQTQQQWSAKEVSILSEQSIHSGWNMLPMLLDQKAASDDR